MDRVVSADADSRSSAYRLSSAALAALLLCYGLQLFSPLRLNTDSVVLLSMADSAARGNGFLNDGARTVFPLGYPALVAALQQIGLGNSSALIALNLMFLAAGLMAVRRLLRRHFEASQTTALNICSLFLLSFVVIKHVTIPLTDVVFFGIAMVALDLLDSALACSDANFAGVLVIEGWILVVGSIFIRRIGIALLPALLYTVIFSPQIRKLVRDARPKVRSLFAALALAATAATVWVISATSTVADFSTATRGSARFVLLSRLVSFHLVELGELALNLPASRLPEMVRIVVPGVGLILFLVAGRGFLKKSTHIGTVEVFFISYAGILAAWPFVDARFWLAVIPLVIGYVTIALRAAFARMSVRIAVASYCVVFVLLGMAALAYSTRITFAGPRFPLLYGDGTMRASYCFAYQWCTDRDGNVDPKVVRLLLSYK